MNGRPGGGDGKGTAYRTAAAFTRAGSAGPLRSSTPLTEGEAKTRQRRYDGKALESALALWNVSGRRGAQKHRLLRGR